MTTSTVKDIGRALYEAERARNTVPLISEANPDFGVREAYAVQEAYAKLRSADGAKLVGRKIGLTSRAMQELFGIETPDYGHIFDDMLVANGGTVRRAELIQPMVEIEVAFFIARDLSGPGVDREEVLSATQAVTASIEIIDSRIPNWEITFIDTVADNGSSARCVLAGERVDPASVDLREIEGQLWRNGELVSSAKGSAVLDHPAEAVAWLANAIGEFGGSLRAGDFVLSGALMRAVRVEPGDTFEARFSDLGVASCTFE